MKLVDTHCHLNLPDSFADPEPEFEACASAGIGLILVGLDPESGRRAVELAEGHEDVWAIVGRHPNYAQDYHPNELGAYGELFQSPKAVAVGEVGLDFHWDFATPEQQQRALEGQMEFAKEIGKPVVFHCREAYPELLSFIERWMESHGAVPCLFHCFAGDATDASRAVALDCYFGVDGPITYAKADALRQVVAGLPRDRVVLETDSPYMAPVPYRGKPNRPSHLPHIALKLGEMWGVSSDTVSDVTTANARRFFGI